MTNGVSMRRASSGLSTAWADTAASACAVQYTSLSTSKRRPGGHVAAGRCLATHLPR